MADSGSSVVAQCDGCCAQTEAEEVVLDARFHARLNQTFSQHAARPRMRIGPAALNLDPFTIMNRRGICNQIAQTFRRVRVDWNHPFGCNTPGKFNERFDICMA